MGGIDVSIVSSGHDVADARLHRATAALRRAGLSVEVVALGRADDAPAGCVVRVRPRKGRLDRLKMALEAPWRARGRVLVTLDPDSALGAYARRALVGGDRLRLVADVHEDYAALLADRPWARGVAGRAASWLAKAGAWAAGRADLTVVADSHLAPDAPRRLVVRNLPDLSLLPVGGAGTPDPRPRALYIGDIRASRGLFQMLDAVKAAPAWRLDLVGPVAGADNAALGQALAAADGLADRVVLAGRQPPARAWRWAEGAWAGLLLLDDTPAFRQAMPSKLYEYLACGLPVVTTALARPAALIRQTGAGAVVGDGAEAGAVLREWSENPSAYDEVAAKARSARQRWLAGGDPMGRFARAVARLSNR